MVDREGPIDPGDPGDASGHVGGSPKVWAACTPIAIKHKDSTRLHISPEALCALFFLVANHSQIQAKFPCLVV